MVITMALTVTSPLVGATTSYLTNPTYTLVEDRAPDPQNSKQFAVSALGGTQTGVSISTLNDPFTVTIVRPKSFKTLVVPSNGAPYQNVPKNTWKVITRKGLVFYGSSVTLKSPITLTTEIPIPAGAETNDKVEIAAALSAHIGVLQQQLDNIVAAAASGVF